MSAPRNGVIDPVVELVGNRLEDFDEALALVGVGAVRLDNRVAEFQRAFGPLSDKAAREPLTITKHGRDHLVLMSADEYARLKRRDRRVFATA